MFLAYLLLLPALVGCSLGSPLVSSRGRFEERIAARNFTRRTGPRLPELPQPGISGVSTNWAGGILSSSTPGTWEIVTGTFVLPTPQEPSGATGTHGATIAIGLDGDTCQSATFQTGIDMTVNAGVVSYVGWFQWFPDFSPIDFPSSEITFSPGDSVSLTLLTYFSSTRQRGTAIITNNSKGTVAIEGISAATPLCGQDAEWTVQALSSGAPLANFGSVTFANALTFTNAGGVGFLPGTSLVELETSSGQVLTSVSTTQSTITVNYIGP
ncbi:hypothetical protein PHLGIDRAFT_131248 [Phlebiopsis gigantea 11061_1 CR5-6]|uniref:Acid protease n=1 Tax=Phlebiopsis gigantea (strain 11061_1 CR5-6) TaxID=745531 RepID=A0A0C3NAG7_PHLG1|nr:hypothetical protein PHLGIDRAFT_131248 [Phlebiopsis gigantea 11061_1 CR5-6]